MTSLRETAELEVAAAEDRTRHSLALYYRALCGQVCSLAPYDDGSSPWEHADTETTVWLPHDAPLDDHAEFDADDWYQVAMTHRAMHQKLGTFDLDLDRDEPLFARLRPTDVERVAGDAARARDMLGWAPAIPWDRTLDDVLAYWRCRVRQGTG